MPQQYSVNQQSQISIQRIQRATSSAEQELTLSEKTTKPSNPRLVQKVGHLDEGGPTSIDGLTFDSLESATNRQQVTSPGSDDADSALTLPEIEQMATEGHPAILQARSEIESLRGKLIQAGLPPNPTVGWISDDIGEEGQGGRHGAFVGREIVRGNKLGRARQVVSGEIAVGEQKLAEIEQRVLTDVRQRYYELLVAREKVEIAAQLVKISQQAVDVSDQLYQAREALKSSVLQSEIELQNAIVLQQQADNEELAARRKLAALLGQEDLNQKRIAGNARDAIELAEFELTFDELLANSPELAALFVDVERARSQLTRECAEPIPNVSWQASLQYDTATDDVVTGFQFQMPLPTANRNQGAIKQARHQVAVTHQKAETRVLDLRQRLATEYQGYLNAKVQMNAFDAEILPRAKQSLELISTGYERGEIDFLQLLTAQRTYFQTNLTYFERLREVWQRALEIKGMLLSGSLE